MKGVRAAAWAVLVVPPVFSGLAVALAFRWGGVSPGILPMTVAFYALTVAGITVGYHRLFTHRAFRAATPVKVLLGILGSMAAQGPVIFWVVEHRKHHRSSDQAGDPHSPHPKGFLHAHLSWMIDGHFDFVEWTKLGRDLILDRHAAWINQTYPYWLALGIAMPSAIGYGITGSARGAIEGALWGGFVRILLVHHATWSVNSICHLFGGRRYATPDESRNNALVALVTLGEGWHNNHHAFPYSARQGLTPFELDPSWWIIRGLHLVGAASDVRLPITRPTVRQHGQPS
jgi:stearoyl-CoA desaturase (delta-9 desaturase)